MGGSRDEHLRRLRLVLRRDDVQHGCGQRPGPARTPDVRGPFVHGHGRGDQLQAAVCGLRHGVLLDLRGPARRLPGVPLPAVAPPRGGRGVARRSGSTHRPHHRHAGSGPIRPRGLGRSERVVVARRRLPADAGQVRCPARSRSQPAGARRAAPRGRRPSCDLGPRVRGERFEIPPAGRAAAERKGTGR